jgi:hypothetical protein
MNIHLVNDYLQLAAHAVTILGLPLAIYLFYQEKHKERLDREYGTYNALDDKYIHFLELCLEKPDLDVFGLTLEPSQGDDPGFKRRQEQLLFTILISMLERAFLMYRDQDTKVKECQYKGWVEYMEDYCKKDNFRRQWAELGLQFDSDFVGFMNKLIDKTRPLN